MNGRRRKLVVAALIRDRDDGRILVSQRRADQPMPLLWEFPGGKVESGEAPAAALAREVREELGCDIAVGRIHDVVFHAYPEFDLVMLVYNCSITAGVPRAVQVAQLAWVAPTELPTLDLLPADYPLARALAGSAPLAPEGGEG
ncbi:MAG TPA: (deoxy)nucleoside triphosphate pyrophosphohydrolase [Polyangia bacterium]|jgi:8-oxo-dGTP diphosphatase|nr:(deoxy)nucleoside triphosphate pyrophosphohydrolase [Polyangia bacterium]